MNLSMALRSLVALGMALAPGLLSEGLAGRPAARGLSLVVLSSAPERVSGGDALVRIAGPDVGKGAISVTLNGADISGAFRPEGEGGALVGHVDGLAQGRNLLAAKDRKGRRASLVLTNYPITGPIFSGPQSQPYVCQTDRFGLPDGSFLGPSTDAQCSAPTRIMYLYRTKNGRFLPMADLAAPPADVASVTTLAGKTVPYIVRFEAGTIDRGVYNIAILHDPTREAAPTPASPPAGWAKRLLWVHGFGCPGGWYYQGTNTGSLNGIYPPGAPPSTAIEARFSVVNDAWLSRGYAIATSTLNHPSISCNPILAGEATAMLKEHFIEQYGVPFFTLSTGSSGGAYSSLQIADAFPGLFDGILIGAVFPDALSIATSGLDGHLLTHYFAVTDPAGFTDAQKVAVSGYAGLRAFTDAANQAGRADPVPNRKDVPGYVSGQWKVAGAFPEKEVVPLSLRYDPVANPKGARPTIFDISAAIYGRDPRTGFALSPFDNLGVQYGLDALNHGLISVAQFLDLNEKIGGYDQDANYVAGRSVADKGALARTYKSGISLSGSGGLANIPIFDFAGYNEEASYHYQWFRFAVRERLKAANGNADNHVIWRTQRTGLQIADDVLALMDQWMSDYRSDQSAEPQRAKVVRSRPRALADACLDKDDPTKLIFEPQILGSGSDTKCNRMWPSYRDPRMVAGGPLAGNVLKCRLKPVDMGDYKVEFSKPEAARLRKVFAAGVCDWTRAGVSQVPVIPWASFGPSPVNPISTGRASKLKE